MLSDILLIIFISIIFLAAFIMIIFLIIAPKFIYKIVIQKAAEYGILSETSEKHKIVFLGDSLTEFYKTSEFFHEHNPYNRGIASDTTDGVLNRLASNVIAIEPSKIFLQIGTNDLYARKSPEYVFSNIVSIIEQLQDALPNTIIYIISLYPVNPKAFHYSRLFTGARKNKNIMLINKYLINFSNEKGLTYIDIYKHLLDELGNLKKEYTVEGLHISFTGYQKITEILYSYVCE